jgi:hypothetical protein
MNQGLIKEKLSPILLLKSHIEKYNLLHYLLIYPTERPINSRDTDHTIH